MDSETTNVPILPMDRYYRQCVRQRCPVLSDEARTTLGRRAHGGDCQAREELIFSAWRICDPIAWRYFSLYREDNPRLEYVDLSQTAMQTVLETLDVALAKYDDPLPYIIVAVRHELSDYCTRRCHLIRVPDTNNKRKNAPLKMESIEGWQEENADQGDFDVPAPTLRQPKDHNQLYNAVARLAQQQRKCIEMRFGLHEYAPMSLEEVGWALSNGKTRLPVGNYQRKALTNLRHILEEEKHAL